MATWEVKRGSHFSSLIEKVVGYLKLCVFEKHRQVVAFDVLKDESVFFLRFGKLKYLLYWYGSCVRL